MEQQRKRNTVLLTTILNVVVEGQSLGNSKKILRAKRQDVYDKKAVACDLERLQGENKSIIDD